MNNQQQPPIGNKSMVANLMMQIQAEYASSKQAVEGLAIGTSRHEVIIANTERIANMVFEIGKTHGDKIAMLVMASLPDDSGSANNGTPVS